MIRQKFGEYVVTEHGIEYRTGYRHQLDAHAIASSRVRPEKRINQEYFSITPEGLIFVRAGYAWDGASSIAVDTPGTIYASLFHDVLYQAIRMHLLDRSWRNAADWTYYDLCVAGGVNRIRAYYHYLGLRLGGDIYNNLPDSAYPVHRAP